MENYEKEFDLENEYLAETIMHINGYLEYELERNKSNKLDIVNFRREMWDNSVHFSDDLDRLSELVQHLEPLKLQKKNYEASANTISTLSKMLNTPYFARIDFAEDGYEREKIYIGIANVMDKNTHDIYVYDWRAPISGIFYRFEIGNVYYDAPMGRVNGDVSLKRQYEIKDGKLEFFFDANVNISDQFLRRMLSDNASSKMKTIIETIQRDQDMIIRDKDNELLIVQGVAGSGKTSVALHRVAYLMYQGVTAGYAFTPNSIIIISPNMLFGQYISNVLPELGEDNTPSLIFEDLCKQCLEPFPYAIGSRNDLFEKLIVTGDTAIKAVVQSGMEFKASSTFTVILDRLIRHFESNMIEFDNIYYNDSTIFTAESLSLIVTDKSSGLPLAARLKRLQRIIFERVREMRKQRIKKLEDMVRTQPEHILEVKEYARMLSIIECTELVEQINKFTEIDYLNVYRMLMSNRKLFYELTEGLCLPENIEQILCYTLDNLPSDDNPDSVIMYEDALVVTLLKLKLAGGEASYTRTRQVVVDEAQDYYPIHFMIMGLMFPNARYTILGDISQTIQKHTDMSIYEDIQGILKKKKSSVMVMKKSFRCTTEILLFSQMVAGGGQEVESFNRVGTEPDIIQCNSISEADAALLEEIEGCKAKGYESIGILCKSFKESLETYNRLIGKIEVQLIDSSYNEAVSGVFVMPIYMAKGLEFDAVIVSGTDLENFKTEEDRQMLYIACTRALHRLTLIYVGKPSQLLACTV